MKVMVVYVKARLVTLTFTIRSIAASTKIMFMFQARHSLMATGHSFCALDHGKRTELLSTL
jgi:hypothetical protein